MRTRIVVGVVILLCAMNAYAQEQCKLKLADLPTAPELFGFRMGMSSAEVKVRVPQVAFGKTNEFGVGKTSINPDFDPRIDKASLVGVRTVSLDFLDDRLVSLWFGFDSSFKWKTIPDFVAGISKSLHLPDAWDVWKVRGQRLRCSDFEMTVINVAEGPSFRLIDETAEQTVAERRAAKEEADAATEEAVAFEIIADAKTRNYYPKSCPQSESIDESNRKLFKTREEAEKAGYKLAKLCQ